MGVYNSKGTKNLTEARMATTTSFLPVYHHKAKSSHNSSGEPETNKIRARATPFKHTQLTHSLGLRLLASTCHQLRRSPITTPFPQILRRRACAFELETDHWPPIGLPDLDEVSEWRLPVNTMDDIEQNGIQGVKGLPTQKQPQHIYNISASRHFKLI